MILVFVPGCGIKFMYNQLPQLLPFMISRFIPPNEEQRVLLDTQLARIIEWHRTTQLPRYNKELESLVLNLKYGLPEQRIDYYMDRFEQFGKDAMEHAMPEVIDFLALSKDEQIDILFERFSEKNQEFIEENLNISKDEKVEKRKTFFKDTLYRFVGYLTEEQHQLIDDWAGNVKDTDYEEYTERLKLQLKFKEVITDRFDRALFEQEMFGMIGYTDRIRSKAYEEKREFNKGLTKTLFYKLALSMPSDQRNDLIQKLEGLIEDLKDLAEG